MKTINKYLKHGQAPKNQFKRYLSDINNVFYEERSAVKQLHIYNSCKLAAGCLWIFLFLSYMAIYFIEPFDKPCPKNAKCGVFVHCFEGF